MCNRHSHMHVSVTAMLAGPHNCHDRQPAIPPMGGAYGPLAAGRLPLLLLLISQCGQHTDVVWAIHSIQQITQLVIRKLVVTHSV